MLGDTMFYRFSNVLVFILSHLDNVAPMGLGCRSPIEKDLTFRAEGPDFWALRTGRLGQNVVTFEPKIRVFWPEISVPFCGEGGGVIKKCVCAYIPDPTRARLRYTSPDFRLRRW